MTARNDLPVAGVTSGPAAPAREARLAVFRRLARTGQASENAAWKAAGLPAVSCSRPDPGGDR